MRVLSQRSLKTPLVLFLILSVIVGSVAVARFGKSVTSAGPLDLAGVNNFAILVNTYTNAGPGTILNGDLGYTVPPANPPTVTCTTSRRCKSRQCILGTDRCNNTWSKQCFRRKCTE